MDSIESVQQQIRFSDIGKLIDFITGFVKLKPFKESANLAFYQKGGWEGWLQVELAAYLNRTFGKKPGDVVRRERRIYVDDSLSADIVCTNRNQSAAIELKCESLFNIKAKGGQNTFYNQLLADLLKLSELSGQGGAGMMRVAPLAVGVLMSDESKMGFLNFMSQVPISQGGRKRTIDLKKNNYALRRPATIIDIPTSVSFELTASQSGNGILTPGVVILQLKDRFVSSTSF